MGLVRYPAGAKGRIEDIVEEVRRRAPPHLEQIVMAHGRTQPVGNVGVGGLIPG